MALQLLRLIDRLQARRHDEIPVAEEELRRLPFRPDRRRALALARASAAAPPRQASFTVMLSGPSATDSSSRRRRRPAASRASVSCPPSVFMLLARERRLGVHEQRQPHPPDTLAFQLILKALRRRLHTRGLQPPQFHHLAIDVVDQLPCHGTGRLDVHPRGGGRGARVVASFIASEHREERLRLRRTER